jgi:hypothetical protein
VDGYVGGEAGLELVAVVVQLACVFNDEAVSPFTKPE